MLKAMAKIENTCAVVFDHLNKRCTGISRTNEPRKGSVQGSTIADGVSLACIVSRGPIPRLRVKDLT